MLFLTRMTEQEEDEELLSDLNQAKKTVISFDESPAYIKVGLIFFCFRVTGYPFNLFKPFFKKILLSH